MLSRTLMLVVAAELLALRAVEAQVRPFRGTVARTARCLPRAAFGLSGVRLGQQAAVALRRLSARTNERVAGIRMTEDPAPGLTHYRYRDLEVRVANRGRGSVVEMLSANTKRAVTPGGVRLGLSRLSVRRILGPTDSGPADPALLEVRSCDADAVMLVGFEDGDSVESLDMQVNYPRGRRIED
jgi:hypothetical protein